MLFQCVHTCTYVTVYVQLSTCTQQHALHTPYTSVYIQIEYSEVLLMPGAYSRFQYIVTFTCCTIMYVMFTVLKLTVTRTSRQGHQLNQGTSPLNALAIVTVSSNSEHIATHCQRHSCIQHTLECRGTPLWLLITLHTTQPRTNISADVLFSSNLASPTSGYSYQDVY